MNGKRIEQKGRRKEHGSVEMEAGESMAEGEDESDILIRMREKNE